MKKVSIFLAEGFEEVDDAGPAGPDRGAHRSAHQKKYLLRRSYCHRGMFRSQATIEYRNEKRKATWSPEQIACTPCGLKMPSRTHGVPPVMLPKPSRVRGSA